MSTTQNSIEVAKEDLSRLEGWINTYVHALAEARYPEQWERWQHEAQSVRFSLLNPSTVRIALLGTMGAGKSTLLNAVVGHELLQVGVIEATTSFITLVRYAADGGFEVEVEVESRDEWAADVERFLLSVAPGDDEAGEGESKQAINALRKRIEVVYDISLTEPSIYTKLRDLSVHPEVEEIFAQPPIMTRRFDNEKEMKEFVKQRVGNKSRFWPLVKQVRVAGPYETLKGGIELVDLPGTNDTNNARVGVTRNYIRNSPFVWLVTSMNRGLGDDVRQVLKEEKVLRALVLSGSYHALNLIGTHSDGVSPANAEQLGLDPESDDWTDDDLVRAYRQKFELDAQKKLFELVEHLASSSDRSSTREDMLSLAKNAPIHTVSGLAYIALKGINKRIRKRDGFPDEESTGIPGVLRHLQTIADDVGEGFVGRTACKRIEYLQSEIVSFFRVQAAAEKPEVARARAALEKEVSRIADRTREAVTIARTKLDEKRQGFLSRLEPLFGESIKAVRQVSKGWQPLHHSTLKAIVSHDGVFQGTRGAYDFNEDITDPLLSKLPVAWEDYFTTELGSVRELFAERLHVIAEDFIHRARQLLTSVGGHSTKLLDRQLNAFRDRVEFEKQRCAVQIADAVGEKRRQLAFGMADFARQRMQPAYDRSKQESGTGMKQRILEHLTPSAWNAAPDIFQTIQKDLTEGLASLESILGRLFDDLGNACVDQAGLVAQNVTLVLDEVQTPPELRALLNAQPIPAGTESQ